MSPDSARYTAALDQICTETIGPDAAGIDRHGTFPDRALSALSTAGLMGAVSAPEVGGLGLGFRGAAAIVGRLAQECGSTAMVRACTIAGRRCSKRTAARSQGGGGERRASQHAGLQRSRIPQPLLGAVGTAKSRRRSDHARCAQELGHVGIQGDRLRVVVAAPAARRGSEHPLAGAGRPPGIRVQGPFDGLGTARQRFLAGLRRRRARARQPRCWARTARASTS